MNLENARYYVALICVVFGPSILYTGLVTWPIRAVYHFEGGQLQVLYAVTYMIIVLLGFIFYRKRLRGVI